MRTAFDHFVRLSAAAAAFAFAACAAAKTAPTKIAQAPAPPVAAVVAATAADTAPASMPTGSLTRVGGVVVSVDAAGRSLTIKDYGGRTRKFVVAGGAMLTRGGDQAAVGLDGIAVGDRVRLKVGGDVTASVHVMVSPVQ